MSGRSKKWILAGAVVVALGVGGTAIAGGVGVAWDALARLAELEVAVSSPNAVPEGVDLHVKVDTGMGRWGMSFD